MNYITGERIQTLADVSFAVEPNFVINAQLANTKLHICFASETPIEEIAAVFGKKTILFVYTHFLDFFFTKIFPSLVSRFVLISHNSDHSVSEKYFPFLSSGKIIAWYGQNVEFEHERLFSLPIGIANSQWPHGDLDLLDRIRNENNAKTILVYKNYNLTQYGNRMLINSITNANGIPMSPHKPQEDYLRDISRSVFCICPPGNGVDCHRVWECLYLNCIPIVYDHIHYKQFQELPILLIKDWQKLTMPFLKEQAFIMSEKDYNFEKLDMSYWKQRVVKHEKE